jgi:hypothetical protein
MPRALLGLPTDKVYSQVVDSSTAFPTQVRICVCNEWGANLRRAVLVVLHHLLVDPGDEVLPGGLSRQICEMHGCCGADLI